MGSVGDNEMKKYMLIVFFSVLTLLATGSNISSAATKKYVNTNEPFECRGRLSIYNGNPTFRIWIIGTNRMLGIRGGDAEPADMPRTLEAVFTSTDIVIFGTFKVTPITKYKEGHMQIVRIDSAENLSIYDKNVLLKKLKQLQPQHL